MLTIELSRYVNQQLAAGHTPTEIREVLLAGGWSAADAEQAITDAQESRLENQAAILSATTHPAPGAALRKSGRRTGLWLIGVLILAIVGGGAAVYYFYGRRSTTPSTSSTEAATATYQDVGIQFNYDSSWKKIGSHSLFNGNFTSSTPDKNDSQFFFFTPTNWQTAQNEVSDFQASVSSGSGNGGDAFAQALSLITKISFQAEFSLSRVALTSAHSTAKTATQTICHGGNLDSSTTNPVDESHISSVKVDGRDGYLVKMPSDCVYQNTQVFVDSSQAASPPASGVTISGQDAAADSFILTFINTSDLEHLTPAQKIVWQSLKIN